MANLQDFNFPKEIESALENNDQALAVKKIQEYLEKEKTTPLNIAITGDSGAGKSTFVNAIRGIDNRDESAAPTGCVETTMEVTPYPHPNYPNVTLWDLPGVGTTNFPADKYLEYVGFGKFDFFIIISDTRFKENDVKLAQEIQKMGKKFYYVRSKIDHNLCDAERSQREFNPEKTLAQIREKCIQGLQKQGVESPRVFLVSSFKLHLYDFPLLHETLERELPAHKRNTLLFAMPSISLQVIKKKKEAFQGQITCYSTLSAAGAAAPIPGLSIAVDAVLLVTAVTQYIIGFGLDIPSLKRLSDRTGVPLKDFISVIMSQLAAKEITQELLMGLLSQCKSVVGLMAAEEGVKLFPLFGNIAAASLSFLATKSGLNFFLDMLAEDAWKVFERALALSTSEFRKGNCNSI